MFAPRLLDFQKTKYASHPCPPITLSSLTTPVPPDWPCPLTTPDRPHSKQDEWISPMIVKGSKTSPGPFLQPARFMNHRVPAHKRYQPTEYEHAANCATHASLQWLPGNRHSVRAR
ncbi:hypothetical protein MJG53_018396 [Ovis ammon polii x Ovis aries]|uniref:Uncharacterized protein n=1 Tax=Ovis ammon polii x Ovis aries TaxID=2918886 RepID=A0ACB9U6T6_9CETA|nr:hypothetical protein MJG53_018396 [Ovis ammon polii x Ovis aries]